MKKSNAISIIAVAVVVIGLFIFNMFTATENAQVVEEIELAQQFEHYLEEIVAEPEISEMEDIEVHETESGLRFVEPKANMEETYPLDLTEPKVLNEIHGMSHQKVRAEDKWLFTPLTMPRVERLIEVIEANDFQYEETMLDILNRWAVGDFSKVVNDHNAIWTIKGGNVGKAYGVSTEQEEKEFVENHYDLVIID